MRSIGFRASSGTSAAVVYAITEGDQVRSPGDVTVVFVGEIPLPPALWPPAQLHFLRTVILDVMSEYRIQRAGVRTTEPTARRRSAWRDNIEGVLQELLASSSVDSYFAGHIATIASRLGIERSTFKEYRDGELTPPVAANWVNATSDQREAILTAAAALLSREELEPEVTEVGDE